MKVLLVSVFHPELVRGGAQQVCYELFEGLQQRADIEPVLLAAIDPSHAALYKSGACITGFDGRENEFLFLSRDYDYWWHKCANPRMVEAYVEFLGLVKPDVVHFHHFLLIGIDLIAVTRRVLPDVRIVFTLHEFLSICAADGQMLRKSDRSLCTRASGVRCHQCFPERGPEQFFMRDMWFKRHLAVVDAFTTPSHFMIDRYVRWGLDAGRIPHVTNGQRDYTAGQAGARRPAGATGSAFSARCRQQGRLGHPARGALLRAQGFTDFAVEINGDNLRYARKAAHRDRDVPRRRGGAADRRPNRRLQRIVPCRQLAQRMAGWTGASCRRSGGKSLAL